MNIRQERFAELVASGVPAMIAYDKAGYTGGRNADANAHRMMGNEGVKERIKELRAKTATKVEMKREDLARHLMAVVTTPVGNLDTDSPLVQEVIIDAKGRKRVKMQDKLASARLLCEMMGWKESEPAVVETGPKTLEALEARAASIVSALDRCGR